MIKTQEIKEPLSTGLRNELSKQHFVINHVNATGVVAKKVISIVSSKLGRSNIDPSQRFINDLGADSLDLVEIIMDCEKEFDIIIPDDDAEQIVTVGDAISYIECAIR